MRRLIKRVLLTPPNAFDSSAQAYITAAGITNVSHQNAINTYVLGLKSAGLWDKITARYITYNSATTAATNLVNPSAYLGTVVGSPTINSSGYTSNAASYMRTGIVPATNLTNNNVHFGVWQTNSVGLSSAVFGCLVSSTQRLMRLLSGTTCGLQSYNTGTGALSASGDYRNSYSLGVRRSSTDSEIYSNGVSIATSSTGGGTQPNNELLLDGYNNNGTLTAQGEARRYMMFTLGLGLTTSEALTDYNLTLTLKNSLGL